MNYPTQQYYYLRLSRITKTNSWQLRVFAQRSNPPKIPILRGLNHSTQSNTYFEHNTVHVCQIKYVNVNLHQNKYREHQISFKIFAIAIKEIHQQQFTHFGTKTDAHRYKHKC